MLIGLLSDTHGDVARTAAAASLLLGRKVQAVIHCGDVGSPHVLVELAEHFSTRAIPVYAVLGNVDLFDPSIGHFPSTTGIHVCGRSKHLELDGKRIAIIHGDDERRLRETVELSQFDYVFTGHTHTRSDVTEGRTRIINPGAVYRASMPSVAVLDPARGKLEFLDLDPRPPR